MTEIREEVLYEFFLDLIKAYDALDRNRCMDIIVGYGVIPQMDSILQHYWGHLSMVARAGHYGRTPFKGHIGVTQGDTISPTIFNMVVDLVIHYWVTLVARKEAGPYGFGRSV